ncbi:MAG TPA: DUF4412 domain-containing protein [Candidatus Kapabacteria bacterium]|nr:DUF4412 domain-containing protein [Candidatus Kapabacteria bacterium]
MNRFAVILFFLSAVSFISCSERSQLPGRSFEGKVVQKISVNPRAFTQGVSSNDSSDASSPLAALSMMNLSMTVTMYSKADKVAYDVEVVGFPIKMHSIIDRNARTLTVVTPDKMAYVSDLRSFDTTRSKIDDSLKEHSNFLDSLQAHLPQPTGNKKTINGLDCEEYRSKIGNNDLTMWITHDARLKFYDVIRDALLGKRRTGLGGMEEAMGIIAPFVGEGNVPVRFEISTGGTPFITSEMTEISEEAVDNDLVNIPKGYQVVKQN